MAKQTKGNYIFPSILSEAMKKVSQRTQYEAELMSLACILVGILVMSFLAIFFTDLSFWMKFMTGFNALAAFILLSSRLVTSFQQYQNYLLMIGIIKEHKFEDVPNDERRYPKNNGEEEKTGEDRV